MIPAWQNYKYSVVEREKRFLLETLPGDLSYEGARVIEDRYFPDTRLRLRKITDVSGNILALKLTQKFLSQSQRSEERTITNLYLSEHEYALFVGLWGHLLIKRRYSYEQAGYVYAIDVFEGQVSGLMLAEIALGEQAMAGEQDLAPTLPSFALKEVTEDFFFTGGHLATLARATFLTQLRSYFTNKHPS
jgi:CYTH domain-containing protein